MTFVEYREEPRAKTTASSLRHAEYSDIMRGRVQPTWGYAMAGDRTRIIYWHQLLLLHHRGKLHGRLSSVYVANNAHSFTLNNVWYQIMCLMEKVFCYTLTSVNTTYIWLYLWAHVQPPTESSTSNYKK